MSNGEPHDTLATAFQTDGTGCEHSHEGACADCLADLAIRTLKEHILDELANSDRFEEWYAANAENLDDIEPNMNQAEIVAHYLVDEVLPNRARPVVDVALPEGSESEVMPCGCVAGTCFCDTIDRDWDAWEARRATAVETDA
jgi:hypothetical protein